MLCNLWSPQSAPLLVLVCHYDRPDISAANALPTRRLTPIDVVRALRLARIKRRWIVCSGDVQSLDGIRRAFYQLASECSPLNSLFA